MLSTVENILLFLMIFALMIGIGCSLDKNNIRKSLKSKKSVITGLCLQYLSMPLLAILLINLNSFSSLAAYTILLIVCCPGGSTSNMFTYLAKGNIELSILLTVITTILAIIMTPILLKLFSLGLISNNLISIPFKNILMTLSFVLFPVALGYFIKCKNIKFALKLENIGTKVGYLSMLIMIGIWYPKLYKILKEQSIEIFFTIGLLSFLGISISYFIAKIINLDLKTRVTIGFETGIQNAPLAFAILMLSYPKEQSLQASWIPLVYGALSVGNSIFFLVFFNLLKRTRNATNDSEIEVGV